MFSFLGFFGIGFRGCLFCWCFFVGFFHIESFSTRFCVSVLCSSGYLIVSGFGHDISCIRFSQIGHGILAGSGSCAVMWHFPHLYT